MSRSAQAPSDAFALFGAPAAGGPFILTCEHATAIVPPPLQPSDTDLTWLQQHWGWDIGIEDVTQAILEATSSCGVFSRFSRLVCDPNRDHLEPTWILESIDGCPLDFNARLDDAECARRKTLYHDPYHDAVSALVAERLQCADDPNDVTLLAMHSFTPVFREEIRTMEIGVLYDEQWASAAESLAVMIADEGFVVARNAPYSGYDGLIYSAWRHGNAHKVRYLELEIRQDLIASQPAALAVAAKLMPALERFATEMTRERRS